MKESQKKFLIIMKILMAAAAVTVLTTGVHAQEKAVSEFNRFFGDNTLRIDYIFAGTASTQEIYLDEMLSLIHI